MIVEVKVTEVVSSDNRSLYCAPTYSIVREKILFRVTYLNIVKEETEEEIFIQKAIVIDFVSE